LEEKTCDDPTNNFKNDLSNFLLLYFLKMGWMHPRPKSNPIGMGWAH
jgi:hypothetical protein